MEKGSRSGGMDIYAERFSGLEDKFICSFKLAANLVGGDVQEYVNYVSGAVYM